MAANAAILFAAEAYTLSGPKLMGRQAAGNAFLRAAVAGREGEPLWGYTPTRQAAEQFGALVQEIDPAATAMWCPADRLDLLATIGTLYLPGPTMAAAARLRLRQGAAAYSLCGVTHTTASHQAMDSIAELTTGPLMPWDALICTSQAVVETVRLHLQGEADYLSWRFGQPQNIHIPHTPVIPLGVHCQDYAFSPDDRARARAALDIEEDEVVALFVGRLSFHGKAHPDAMYQGLQAAAQQTGAKLTALQCGWFANEAIEEAFKSGAAMTCPNVRRLFIDGRDAGSRNSCWAAADIFISMSDNIQETFGLTPIEAMAAGLPVIVGDWNGYKDTVRHGIDGFRIESRMPGAGLGAALARVHEAGTIDYDRYCGLACQLVSFDLDALAARIGELVGDAALRRRMGDEGRARARSVYDWPVIYGQYRRLWNELEAQRKEALSREPWKSRLARAPRAAPARSDPLASFAHYPSAHLGADTIVVRRERPDGRGQQSLAEHPFFSYAYGALLDLKVGEAILSTADRPTTPAQIATAAGLPVGQTILAVSVLTKMGLLQIRAPNSGAAP